jgi:ribose-phosphate pyrophosphokinase
VSAIKIGSQKRLVIVSGRAYIELAAQVAKELDTELVHTDARTFANGEIYARFDESVRGTDMFVIQSHTNPINEWLMEQLIMVDAAKRACTRRAAAASRSRPGWSPTCSRRRAPIAS